QEALTELAELSHRLLDFSALARAETRELRVRPFDPKRHEVAEAILIANVEHAHTAPRNLVFVRGTNATSGGAERLRVRALAVDKLVIREHEMRTLAHV